MKITRLLAVIFLAGVSVGQGWVERTQLNRPVARLGHGMCWDPVRGYVLMAGGMPSSQETSSTAANDTWSWDGATWTSRGPSPFVLATLVVHESTQKVLALGSTPTTPGFISCYEWNGVSWQTVPFAPNIGITYTGGNGYAPQRYCAPAASYDPIRQEIIAFTGASQVAVFDGTSWSTRTMSSSSYGAIISAAFDPVGGRIVVTAEEVQYQLIGATWIGFPITRWYEWNGVGLTFRYGNASPTVSGCSTTDTVRQRLIHFDADSPTAQAPAAGIPDHTWVVANGTSTRLSTPVTPTPRAGSAMAFDPARGRVVLFGGSIVFLAQLFPPTQLFLPTSDTWEFDLGPLATFTSYGTGCVASRGVPRLLAQPNSLPRVNNSFSVLIDNLPWSAPTFLLFGLSNTSSSGLPLPFDLSVAGAPGCTLLTSIDNIIPVSNVLGSAAWTINLPNLPGASFYLQAVPFEASANSLGVALSNGGHGLLGL